MRLDVIITIIGVSFSAIGSLILSIRVKILLKCIGLVLRAHDASINAITQVINNPLKRLPVLLGTTKYLEKINDTKCRYLFISGLLLIAFGILFQILGIYLRMVD